MMSEKKFSEAEDIINDFIWCGKKAQINIKTLMAKKENGGLGLVNLCEKHKSLIIKWVQSSSQNALVNELAKYFLGKYYMNGNVWKCNLHKKDCGSLYKNNSFWVCVLRLWCSFHYHEPQNQEAVLHQSLWLNSMIRIGNEPVLNDAAAKKGLFMMQDIVQQESMNFLQHEEIVKKYGPVITWFEYSSLINAIPKLWKFFLHNENLLDSHVDRYDLVSYDNFANVVYKFLNTDDTGLKKSAQKWSKLLNEEFDFATHKAAFLNLYSLTNITKLRNFQYRLLHNKIFCNDQLYYWKKVPSQNCDFCQTTKQNIVHLMYTCEYSTRIWHSIKREMKKYDIEIEINCKKYYVQFGSSEKEFSTEFPCSICEILHFQV